MTIEEQDQSIIFDENDQMIFYVDDPRLRADALKHSVLPKLTLIMNNCIMLIKNIYDVEVLNDSLISLGPNFRTNRDKELTEYYELAHVLLGGKRLANKWQGVTRSDGKPLQILPFKYGFTLSIDGLNLNLSSFWLKGMNRNSYRKLFDFLIENESIIHYLSYFTTMEPVFHSDTKKGPIVTLKEQVEFILSSNNFTYDFVSDSIFYPISLKELYDICMNFVAFYPVYDSYIQIALGQEPRFNLLIEKLNRKMTGISFANRFTFKSGMVQQFDDQLSNSLTKDDALQIRKAAERQVKVMPGIRWQVFTRDNWKCVACGRGSKENVILHVDHIVPRSKGGKDELDNFQTLCQDCNLGKSNKDNTDLRKKR